MRIPARVAAVVVMALGCTLTVWAQTPSAPPASDPGVAGGTQSSTTTTQSSDQNTTPNPPAVQEAAPDRVKHDGGEDDVDAIGNRKIGKRGFGNWYSLETEIRMGKQYAMQVESTVKLVQD